MNQFVLALALALATLFGASELARADDASEARYHFERGIALSQSRDYHGAIDAFLLSNRSAPNPRAIFNVATCFHRLGNASSAYSYYAEYLRGEDDIDGADTRRSAAEAALATLASRVARLRVTTEPPGAAIYVDRVEMGEHGRSPREMALEAGTHRVTLVLDGYREATREVSLTLGATQSLHVSLERILGTLRVHSETPVDIEVVAADGTTRVEARSPTELRVPPGVYTVSGGTSEEEALPRTVTVGMDEASEVSLDLVPRPRPTGSIMVSANVNGALVILDDVEVGFSPVILREIEVGEHRVRVEYEGMRTYGGRLTVTEGQRTWLTATLVPADSSRRRPATYATGAVGAAALMAGLSLAPVSARTHNRFQDASGTDPTRAASLRERGRFLNRTSDALTALGGAGLVLGVTFYFTVDRPRDVDSSANTTQRSE